MAVNQQRGLLQVASNLEARTGPAPGGFQVPGSGGAQAATAAAAAAGKIASSLSGLSQQIGAYADQAAQAEGERAGRQAGLDPEFRPTRSMTIRGDAYDRAGLSVYQGRVRLEIENDIENGGDLAKKRAAWLGQVPEEMRPEVTHMFQRGELVRARAAAREHDARIRSEATGVLQSELDAALKGLHQRSFALGLDEKADGVLSNDLALLERSLKRNGPDGKPLVAPASAAKILVQAREAVTDARLLGAFERLPTNDARETFIARIEEDFAASQGLAKNYDLSGFRRVTGQLRGSLGQHRAEERQATAGVREELATLGRMAEKGYAPNADQMAALKARVTAAGTSPELQQGVAKLEDMTNFQAELRARPPSEVEEYISAETTALQAGGEAPTPHRLDRLKLAENYLTEMRKGVKTNMLGWAHRTGQSKIAPLEFSDPEKAVQSFKQRIVQAEDVAEFYGVEPQYLQPEERRALSVIASQGGSQAVAVASMISQHGGKRSQKILAEMFTEAPVFATIGGLVASVGDQNAPMVAVDAANGIALSKTEGYKRSAPPPAETRKLSRAVHGGTLSGFPGTEQALITATDFAYEVRLQREGGLNGAAHNGDLWQRTFREMLGERVDDKGEKYGGVAFSRAGRVWGGSGAVVIPPDIKNAQFSRLISSLTIADFGDDPPRYAKQGKPAEVVSAADLRAATLTPAGRYQYYLDLGDDNNPQELMSKSGQVFVLDLEKMEPELRRKFPQFYLGGGDAPAAGPGGASGARGPVLPIAPDPNLGAEPPRRDVWRLDDFEAKEAAQSFEKFVDQYEWLPEGVATQIFEGFAASDHDAVTKLLASPAYQSALEQAYDMEEGDELGVLPAEILERLKRDLPRGKPGTGPGGLGGARGPQNT